MENTKVNPKVEVKKHSPIIEDVENDHDIDPILKKELLDQGLNYRFIDFKQAKLNGGRSRSGWVIYRRNSEDPRLQGIKALADPDGLVRQGSLVLAVKTQQSADRQRSRRDAQNRSLKQYTKTVADELDQTARKLGGSSRIISGYEKNS